MYPILFSVGSLDIHANTIFFVLGCLAGLWVGYREVIRQVTKKQIIYDLKGILKFFAVFLPFVYLFGMVNAWFFQLDSIILHPSWQRLAFSGWISYGGIIGALLFGWLYPKIVKDVSVGTLDIVALILPIFEGVYRIGCLLNGCCYGRETFGFGGIFLPNSIGQWAVRYPTQILYIALGFGLFVVLWLTRKKKEFEGDIALRYLIIYGAGRFLIDGLRADSIELGWINLHQAMDLCFMVAGLTIFGVIFSKINRKKNVI